MLCIIFTKKRLLAGVKTEIPQLLKISGKSQISYEGRAMHEVLHAHLADITEGYKKILQESGKELSQPYQATLAFPVDFASKDREKNQVISILQNASPHPFEVIHSENLAISFLYGLKNQDHLPDQNCVILESIDDYVNVCYHTHQEGEDVDVKEFGSLALFTDEAFSYEARKDIGYSKGNEQILNQLLKEFADAGLTVDVKGQTDLALQLMNPAENQRYTYSLLKMTQNVNIQAQVELSRQRFSDLMATNRESLANILGTSSLQQKDIQKVILLGKYLKNQTLRDYLNDGLDLKSRIISMDGGSEYDEFATIIEGLNIRTSEVIQAEEIRKNEEERKKLEEAKRAKIEAELKVKDSRESLLEELQKVCIDPLKQEEYEEQFVARGIKLGIPDVVIKWNISEVLSRIALQKEVESVGLTSNTEEQDVTPPSAETTLPPAPENKIVDPQPKETPVSAAPKIPAHQNGTSKPTEQNGHAPKVEKSPESVPSIEIEKKAPSPSLNTVVNETPQIATLVAPTPPVEKKEEVVKKVEVAKKEETKKVEVAKKEEVKKEIEKKEVKEKKEEKAPTVAKTETQKQKEASPQAKSQEKKTVAPKKEGATPKISLNDIFVIKGSLPDIEFSSKKVTFHSDQELKVVRLLSTKDQKDETKVANFHHLYKKELKYFEEMSEMSESKEGMYYYRPFLERNTLKDHVGKLGLDKKKNLDDLSSSDLKFILQIFKEVRELKVSHANLTAENILIVAKRKWNLQKNMEIKFIGFTSKDVDNNQMIEQTHSVFGNLMGEELYKEFRQKFQL